jgi:hypothetical protein
MLVLEGMSKTQLMVLPRKKGEKNSGIFRSGMVHFKFTQLQTWPEVMEICYTATVLCMAHFEFTQ